MSASLSSLILIPFYTKFLSPEGYGILSSIEALRAIAVVIITLGLERSMYRVYYDYKGVDKSRFLGTLMLGIAFVSTVVTIALLTIAARPLQQLFPGVNFSPYFILGILTSFATSMGAVPTGYFQLSERPDIFTIFSIGKAITSILLSVLFFLWFRWGIIGILTANLAVEVLFSILAMSWSFKFFKFSFSVSMLKAAVGFALPMFPSLVSSWFINMSNRVIIARYLSQADLGVYSFAQKITSISALLGSAFMLAYQPLYYRLISERGEVEARTELRNYSTWFVILVGISITAIGMFSREITLLFADSRYLQASALISLMGISVFANQLTGLNNLALYQSKRTLSVMMSIVLSAVIIFILNTALIPVFGLYGAVYAVVIAVLFNFVFTLILARRAYRVGLNILPILVLVIVTIPATIISLLLDQVASKWIILMKISMFIIVFLALIYISRKKLLIAIQGFSFRRKV